MTSCSGKVYLVGAGPGEPGLITLRGFGLLQQADVVFYDYLVDPAVLFQAGLVDDSPQERKLVCLGRHGHGRILTQDEVNTQLVTAARAGKTVVRLKGGDPAVFGRTAEEIVALEAAGIEYDIVPGVTAALAASSYSGIPLTQRDTSSCVAFITGQESSKKQGEPLDWEGLARFPGTLVFYMGVTTAAHWSNALLTHGKSPSTPVAVIRHCTFADQEVVRTTLGELAKTLEARNMRPPAIVVVGEVVQSTGQSVLSTQVALRARRPLWGQTVMVTRPQHQATDMLLCLNELGATALLQPAITIAPPESWDQVDDHLRRLGDYDWLAFSSANGVNYFLNRLLATGRDLRDLAHCQLAAIGSATAERLAAFHLNTDLQPDQFRAEALATALAPQATGKHVLLLRASRGREVLAEMLSDAGVDVSQVVVYRSDDVSQPGEDIQLALRSGKIDWITVTSSAIARSLVRMFGDDLRQAKLAAISPLTADVLTEAGFDVAAVAEEYTTAGLLEAVVEHS